MSSVTVVVDPDENSKRLSLDLGAQMIRRERARQEMNADASSFSCCVIGEVGGKCRCVRLKRFGEGEKVVKL